MAGPYKTPGVYIEEISKFPPSVAQVETAIPAFIGYTEKAETGGIDYLNKSRTYIILIRIRNNFWPSQKRRFLHWN